MAESGKVVLAQDNDRKNLFLQHPYILTADIIPQQEAEGFTLNLEGTIGNLLPFMNLKGVPAPMPPEFDTWAMFEANKRYIDEHLRKS